MTTTPHRESFVRGGTLSDVSASTPREGEGVPACHGPTPSDTKAKRHTRPSGRDLVSRLRLVEETHGSCKGLGGGPSPHPCSAACTALLGREPPYCVGLSDTARNGPVRSVLTVLRWLTCPPGRPRQCYHPLLSADPHPPRGVRVEGSRGSRARSPGPGHRPTRAESRSVQQNDGSRVPPPRGWCPSDGLPPSVRDEGVRFHPFLVSLRRSAPLPAQRGYGPVDRNPWRGRAPDPLLPGRASDARARRFGLTRSRARAVMNSGTPPPSLRRGG